MTSGTDQAFDSISLDDGSDACVLTLLAYQVWDQPQLLLLQERINLCLQAIESGDITLAHPGSRGREFIIDLRTIYAPDAATFAFLTQAQTILEEAGHLLRFGPLGSSYVEPDD